MRARNALLPAPRSVRRAGLLAAIALHLGAIGAVLAYEPVRSTVAAPATIAVEWIAAAPRVEEPPPAPEPVKAAPRPKRVQHASPVPSEPVPIAAAPAPAPAPEQPAEPPVPAPAAVPARAAVAAVDPAPAPVAITPPIYKADYLANPAPPYPALSRRTREQGRVILRVHVTAAGTVDDVQLRTSSGHTRLDDSALETVKRWQFVPAKRGAEPVAAWVLVPISFGLDS